jgi:DNA-binding CsgD family transcriptional regulator
MLGVLDSNWNFVISAAIMVFEFTLWCLLAFVSYQRQVSPVIVMGFGYGIYMLGNTAGWLLGSSGLPGIIEGPMVSVFYLLVAGAVLVLAFLLFSERDFERLFAPADLASASLSELMQEDILNSSQAASSEGADEQPQEHRRGRFMQQVGELARAKKLSPRETEVLRFLAMGRSSDFISEQLSISWNTARTHIHNVYVKLNVHSREELMNLMDSLKMS